MPYTLDQGKKVLKDTIQFNLRHRDYDRVNKIADMYTRYTTGEDVQSLLRRFTPREDEALFAQRVNLTQVTTGAIVNALASPMYKVGRSHASKHITWEDKKSTEEKALTLSKATNKFFGKKSVESYLNTRMVELDCSDPNTFIVVEFKESVDPNNPKVKASPYPYEVNSKEAINYLYINNELQFLIVKNDKHAIYLQDQVITGEYYTKESYYSYSEALLTNQEWLLIYTDDKQTDIKEAHLITTLDHLGGEIPAIRIGSNRDLTTRGRTCVPMIHAAMPFFEKSIKTVSEFDLTNCLHTFPQKIQYDEVCPGDFEKGIMCNKGKITTTNNFCPVCKGSGWKTHTSAADIIRVRLPKDTKDMVSLENYISYKGPALDLLEYQKKLALYELPQLAMKAVYTSELYSSDNVTSTATEKNIDLESVYDTLKPFADHYSDVYKHIVTMIASFIDLGTGIDVHHSFYKDFKMKTVSMLLSDLDVANKSGAESYVKSEINKDITDKLYIDKPDELMKIKVKTRFYPFNGKSVEEINNIILNDITTKYNKVLYANFDYIFDQIEAEYITESVNFYRMEGNKQAEIVKTKVNDLILEINDESTPNDFGAGTENNTFPVI